MSSIIDYVQPVSCPACFAKDPVIAHLDPLDTQDLRITLPSSRETISFKDATRTFIEEHYPDLDSTTYRVPAALFYDHKGDLDLATNEEVLSDETLCRARGSAKRVAAEVVKDRFQKDSVEKVVRCFHSWGSEHGEGILVLSEYKIQDYLRAVKTGRKSRKKMVGDHDVMLIHLNTGVVFVQVKSVQDTSAWKTMRGKIRSAFEQVAKDEKAFRELNADLDFISTVPVVGFVALPELAHDHLERMGVCVDHKKRVLTMEHLQSSSGFNQWVRNYYSEQFQRRGTLSLGLENYKELCGRYVGLASVVRIRTLHDAVKKTSAKVGKIMLTPEQNEMIRVGNRRQVIFGEYGTGKSLILAKMAEKIVASGEGLPIDLDRIIFVVSYTSVSHTRTMGRVRRSPSHLVSHFRNLISESMSSSVKIMSIADLFRYCIPDADPYFRCLSPATMAQLTRRVISMHPEASVHIMWDEVPFVPYWDWRPLKDLGDEYPGTFIWVTIATGTYVTMNSGEPAASVLDKLPPNFVVSQLTRCMRMTRNGFRFYQALQTFLGDNGCCSTASGNAVDGCVPQWYPLQNCFCGITNPLGCTCIHARLSHTLKHVWGLLKNIDPSLVSFVLRDSKDQVDRFLMGAVRDACEALGIPAGFLPTSDNDSQHHNHPTPETSEIVASGSKCPIVDIFSYKGCENPVVIFVSLYGWPLVWEHRGGRHGWDDISPQISRALGQIFIITWPRRDIDHFSREAVLNMITSYSSFPLPTSDEEAEFHRTMMGKFEEVLEVYSTQDRKDFLEYLVEKKVLVKCQLKQVHDDSPINSTMASAIDTFF